MEGQKAAGTSLLIRIPISRQINFPRSEKCSYQKVFFKKEAGSKLNYFACASKNSLVKFEEMINDLITCEARIFMFNYYTIAKSLWIENPTSGGRRREKSSNFANYTILAGSNISRFWHSKRSPFPQLTRGVFSTAHQGRFFHSSPGAFFSCFLYIRASKTMF